MPHPALSKGEGSKCKININRKYKSDIKVPLLWRGVGVRLMTQ